MNSLKVQHGLIMITTLLVVFMAGTSMFFVVMSSKSGDIQKKIEHTTELKKVKDTLLSFAVNYPDMLDNGNYGPGRLPCPDRNFNDRANNRCDEVHQLLGKLPRYITLNNGSDFRFSDFYDDDQQFWYSVSSAYRDPRSIATIVNSSIPGTLTLDGADDYIAVIISPGEELSSAGQDRTIEKNTTNWNDSEHFLEYDNQDNGNGNPKTNFISAYADDPDNFNDQVIGITRNELMTAVTPRVIKGIKSQLDNDFVINGNTYPIDQTAFDSDMNAGALIPGWYTSDEWNNVTFYTFNSATSADIRFDDCNIIYTLTHNGAESMISKSANLC